MAAFVLNIKRAQSGLQKSTGVVPPNVSGQSVIVATMARSPDDLSVVMNVATHAQVQGLLAYATAIGSGSDTSEVETAIALII